jgi:predicted RNA binding protein YcfA (HicA-like mRNA interferase family)
MARRSKTPARNRLVRLLSRTPRCWGTKIRDVIRLLLDDGWYLARTRGSHQQLKHPAKPGLVAVAGHPADDLAPRTLNSILKQAGLKP